MTQNDVKSPELDESGREVVLRATGAGPIHTHHMP